ncbi:TonB-dependent receptor domain-containing protein [Hymenobacter sp. GOD-10R]|uniref:TonB-dependent receptor domain-containing protein n=1 Tax=Hymenobacter sp. GOD-10R TaxID=3093922 RepID=UPI002D7795EA|nr:TonB-dependent receptor [Hymenobacter sp. GOD-10R]WRQ31757.1 TonB-dependent receptor [Hymenobacter sp. GOD-10R]
MKTIFAPVFLFVSVGAAQSQSINVDKDYSLLVNSEKGIPCQKCTLKYSANDGTILGYKVTDSLGLARLPVELLPQVRNISIQLDKGWYGIALTRAIEPSSTIALTLIGEKAVSPLQKTLKEVIVTGHQQLIEDTGEAVIYNVAADIANSGTDATDVLRRTPLVSVDINGTPSIKGSTSIKILLNGRAVSYLQPSDLLAQIPSDLITKVEVITAPGAKYDADGAAGIINIITKNPVTLNHSGSLNTGLGSKGSHLFASDTYNTKNLSISNGLGFLSFYNSTQATQIAQYAGEKTPFFDRASAGRTKGLSSSYQGSIATLNKKNFFELSVNAFLQTIKPEESFSSYARESTNSQYQGSFASNNKTANISSALSFERKFDKNGQKVNATIEGGYLPTDNIVHLSQEGGFLSTRNRINNKNTLYNSSAKVDYEFNLHKKHFIEAGIKAAKSYSAGTNDAVLDSSSLNSHTASHTDRTGYQLTYSVTSSYFSYKLAATPRFSSKLGFRYEYTSSKYLLDKQAGNLNSYNRGSLFPALTLVYKLSNTSTLTGNYNYRIQRPPFSLLLPVASYISSGIKYIGNPYLNPEFSHVVEVSVSKYIEANYFRASVYTTLTQDAVSSIISQQDGTTTTYINAGSEKIVGLNFWATIYPVAAWSINYGFDFNYRKISNILVSNTGFRLTNTLNTTFRIGNKWSTQLWGTFNTPKILLQGTENSYTFSNISVKRELINKKLFLAISVDNPFSKGFTQKQRIILPEYNSSNEVLYYSRGFRLLLNYKFGNNKNGTYRSKESSIQSGFDVTNLEIN